MAEGNYKRKHFIALAETGKDTPPTTWERLGAGISSIVDSSSDETDATVYYDSEDGNPEEVLLSRPEVWTFEGIYNAEDKAHQIVAKARRSDDSGRKIWHKIEETDGSEVVGLAKLFDPVAGGGDAAAKETISGRLAYIKKPSVKPSEGA